MMDSFGLTILFYKDFGLTTKRENHATLNQLVTEADATMLRSPTWIDSSLRKAFSSVFSRQMNRRYQF